MVDFLLAWMQALCLLGLLCGAYYSLTWRRGRRQSRTPPRRDPVATHIEDVTRETMPDAHT